MTNTKQTFVLTQYIDLGKHDFFNKNIKYIKLPNQPYTINIYHSLPNYWYKYYHNEDLIDIDETNFKKVKNSPNYPNNIMSFKKIDETSFIILNTGIICDWQIDKATLTMNEINEDPKIREGYINGLKITKLLTGICPVNKRINEIRTELNEIKKIREDLLVKLPIIKSNLNTKSKHHGYNSQDFKINYIKFNKNNKYRNKILNHPCSITNKCYDIFKDKKSYLDAINNIKKYIVKQKIMNDEQLNKIFNNKNIVNCKKAIKITNLYLISDMLDIINSYITYLTNCIKNLEDDPYSLKDDFSHNNVKTDMIYFPEQHDNQYELHVTNSNINGFIRVKKKYYQPSSYKLYQHQNKWNIMCNYSEIEISQDKIDNEIEWRNFYQELNKNAEKQYKKYKKHNNIKNSINQNINQVIDQNIQN